MTPYDMPEASDAPQDTLSAMARAQPDKTAIIDDRPGGPVRSMTYRELNGYVNRLANGLLSLGVEPGDSIMWVGQNSIEVSAFSHAARKIGTVSVPLNYRLTDEESMYVITNSDSVLVFADAPYADMLDRIRSRIPAVDNVVIFSGAGPTGGDPIHPHELHPGQIAETDLLGAADEPPPTPSAGKVMI
ncbi:MAG: AMP-binding protein, partial [Acidimicrobiia bacterium]|nr:AMP-binding protein [Acidimicrobiia bacterium]